jgi:2-oxoglutarate ferredoxin oxidoreductase subunit alpha
MTVLDRPAEVRPHLLTSPPGTGGEASPLTDRVLMKGNEAIAEAAIAAGCDAYFGYPITPQAELLEWMARRMPQEGRVFVQAESELAAINMALGASAAGARVLVSSSSPGISLMAEAMSYMAGSRLPVVLVNVMRGGPGLGSIGAAQGDYLQATKGHGHGDYRVPVLAPSSIAEAIDLVRESFIVAERYRTPVILLADGILGQAMEPVSPTFRSLERRPADWILDGADGREPRVVKSLHLRPEDLERHDIALQAVYAEIMAAEQRWAGEALDGAEIVLVAYGTAARVARTAVTRARAEGIAAGLFRPISLWPYPAAALREAATGARAVMAVEMSAGQMVEDVRLALEGAVPVFHHGRMGGMVPTPDEVVDAMRHALAVSEEAGR